MGQHRRPSCQSRRYYGEKERRLEWEIFVHLSPGRLEASLSHKEGGSVPSNLVKAMEAVCNLGNSRSDDGLRSQWLFQISFFLILREISSGTLSRDIKKTLMASATPTTKNLAPEGYSGNCVDLTAPFSGFCFLREFGAAMGELDSLWDSTLSTRFCLTWYFRTFMPFSALMLGAWPEYRNHI